MTGLGFEGRRGGKDSSFIWLLFFLYCLSAFLPFIVYQHFFFPKQNMKSSCGAMSRGPKSSPLFGMAEELAKKSAFSLSLLSQLFFSSFFILFSSSDLLHLLFLNFSFARAGKKSCKRKRLFHVRCRPAASGRWKSSAQEAVAPELAGPSGSFYFCPLVLGSGFLFGF